MIKVNLSLPVDSAESLEKAAARKLKVPIKAMTILKKSIDARDKGRLLYSYTLAVETNDEATAELNGGHSYVPPTDLLAELSENFRYAGVNPVVVGMGPAGLFAALSLCKMGAKPIIIERGGDLEERKLKTDLFNKTLKLDSECNALFGEGGAGTFSDGKLNTGINSPFIRTVLAELAANGAPEEILYLNKPHIGTDMLEKTVVNLRKKLISYGVEVHFNTKVTDIIITNGKVKGVRTDKGDFYTDKVYLAIGHSARDTFEMLYAKGAVMESKIFSMGVRIEHLQSDIDRAQYGRARGSLPPADYKAAVKLTNGKTLYTFCMCPGGSVVNTSGEEGGVCINGMSNFLRNGINANSALLINVTEAEYGGGVMAGVNYQRSLEQKAYSASKSFKAPAQTVGDFLKGRINGFRSVKPSIATGTAETDLNGILPAFIANGIKEGLPLIARRIRGFDSADAVLTGVETRSSSPVRILRDDNYCSSLSGLYPIGEGAGYAGGITSAAVDGIRGVLASLKQL